ncbi:MAG: hypothetical protein H8E66_27540 [Planctomycetes bacterium]|nr:hypothetical protein [Planctomycetota bacterium]
MSLRFVEGELPGQDENRTSKPKFGLRTLVGNGMKVKIDAASENRRAGRCVTI